MKDYSIGENKKRYILKIEENQADGTFTVFFADGTKLTDVEANEANIRKVIETQAKQAKFAVDNKDVFVGKKTKAGIMTALSTGAVLAATTAVSNIPVVERVLAAQDPVVVAAGIGVITVLGSIPAFSKLMRESAKVTELEKLEYLRDNMDKLGGYKNYHNSLTGLSKKVASHFDECEDPYCILDIDEYDIKDLKTIMENIEKEESFGFTYKKKPTGQAK